jgi:hypothetical protein
MPIDTASEGERLPLLSARGMSIFTESQISRGSCSTCPGAGKYWVNSLYELESAWPVSSKQKTLLPVVPRSIDKIYFPLISAAFQMCDLLFNPRNFNRLAPCFYL